MKKQTIFKYINTNFGIHLNFSLTSESENFNFFIQKQLQNFIKLEN